MNQLDMYYRAYRAYRAALSSERGCARATHAFAATEGQEAVSVTRATCVVDENWINAIETGLVHIEKAIKEERQFIHSNGEVIPIEKVKHVSKDSVRHLARHAELITRAEEGKDLTPDKLYTVERLSDYAVYENRFLYMLLCYLRDFVTLRYRSILELTHRYEGRLSVEKDVTHAGRTVHLRIELEEERRDDEYLREHNAAKGLIDRMDLILKTVSAFLATPLMESAGKAAMLKPPITKTNVLKMDNNFKGAVALYDYIIAYEGPGYTVEESVTELSPLPVGMAEDMADAELLLSFLAYSHGLNMGEELKAAYDADEARVRQEELRQRTEQMEALRRRLEREGEPVEAYILALEKQVRALQHEADRLDSLYAEVDDRRRHEIELAATVDRLTTRDAGFDEELKSLEATHAAELDELTQAHRRELFEKQGEQVAADAAWQARLNAKDDEHRAALAAAQQIAEELRGENARMQAAYEALQEEKRLLEARVKALRFRKGQVPSAETGAYTDKADFDELEKEYEAFGRYYKRAWKKTKRQIRKEVLTPEEIMGKGHDADT